MLHNFMSLLSMTVNWIIPAFNTYNDVIFADSPVAYWTLDDKRETTLDYSGSGIHGEYLNSPTQEQTALMGYGTSVLFNGTTQAVKLAPATSTPVGTALDGSAKISIEAWIKLTDLPSSGAYTIFSSCIDGTANGFALYYDSTNKLTLEAKSVTGDTPQTVSYSTALSSATTYHIVGIVDYTGDNLYLFVDNLLVASNTTASFTSTTYTLGTPTNSEYIGCSNDGTSNFFKGTIDEVAIYDSELTKLQISEHYYLGIDDAYRLDITEGAPVGYWQLDESSASSAAYDSAGYNNGTYTNTPTVNQTGLMTEAGTSVAFNGSTQRVTMGTNNSAVVGSLINGSSAVTIEAWVNSDIIPTTEVEDIFYSAINSNASGFGLYLDTSGNFSVGGRSQTADGFQGVSGTTVTATASTTYHVVGILDYTNKTAKIYVNGLLDNSASSLSWGQTTYTLGTPTGYDSIAAACNDARHWDGFVDEVAVYDYALSGTDIARHYYTGLGATYRQTVLAKNPVAYWLLDETTGASNFVDIINSEDLTIGGTPTFSATALAANTAGTSITFDGSTDYGESTTSSYRSSDNTGSIEFWFKTTSTSGDRTVFCVSRAEGWDRFEIYVNGSGQLYWNITGSGGDARYKHVASSLNNGSTWHVVLTCNGSTYKLYVNGSSAAFIDGVANPPDGYWFNDIVNTTNRVSIGRRSVNNSSGNYWSGTLDEIILYNYELTAAQALENYNAGTA